MFSFGVVMYEAITGKYYGPESQEFPRNIIKTLNGEGDHELDIQQNEANILRKLLVNKKTRASELLQDDYFSGYEKEECIVTLTEESVSKGIFCSEDSQRHFISYAGFHGLIKESLRNRIQFGKLNGQIRCPGMIQDVNTQRPTRCKNCFSVVEVMQTMIGNQTLMEEYVKSLNKMTEDRAESEMQSKIEDMKEELKNAYEKQGEV
mmetsp:Transcript_21367/g.29888  ORF Transcript_21367/g.29888 Transcript_21367/m.29888 type:complete len:206 (+) Transcript_21367:179-796(+)